MRTVLRVCHAVDRTTDGAENPTYQQFSPRKAQKLPKTLCPSSWHKSPAEIVATPLPILELVEFTRRRRVEGVLAAYDPSTRGPQSVRGWSKVEHRIVRARCTLSQLQIQRGGETK